MADDLSSIDLGSRVGFEVHIHPLVGLQILDLYYRKFGSNKQQPNTMVAGTLLGSVFTNKVHITNCYAV